MSNEMPKLIEILSIANEWMLQLKEIESLMTFILYWTVHKYLQSITFEWQIKTTTLGSAVLLGCILNPNRICMKAMSYFAYSMRFQKMTIKWKFLFECYDLHTIAATAQSMPVEDNSIFLCSLYIFFPSWRMDSGFVFFSSTQSSAY